MAQALDLLRDEATALERQVDELWPDPAGVVAELDSAAHELSKVRAEIQALDGHERYRVSLILTSCTLTFLAIVVFAIWILGAS